VTRRVKLKARNRLRPPAPAAIIAKLGDPPILTLIAALLIQIVARYLRGVPWAFPFILLTAFPSPCGREFTCPHRVLFPLASARSMRENLKEMW
jgi:hypothetical protein